MTEEEIKLAYEEMVEQWGDKLPNYDHEPIRFAYYVRMYKHMKALND